MNVRVRSLAIAAIAFLPVALGVFPAAAVENETFGLTPQPERIDGSDRRTFGIPLEPGSAFEDAIRIYNRTDQSLDLAVYAADAEAGSDGTISVGFRAGRPKGVGAWIDLSADKVDIPPHGEVVVPFRVKVRSADPTPDLGAIVAENTARGLSANLAARLHLVVRTSPPNSPTTSVRVRPLLLRSPWIIVAILGLIAALVIIWLGARRARRPKDDLVPVGGLQRDETEPDETPPASRPVLRRLGESEDAQPGARRKPAADVASTRQKRAESVSRQRSSAPRRTPAAVDERQDPRPLIDDLLVEVDQDEREPAATPAGGTKRRPPQRRTKASTSRRAKADKQKGKTNFIPLDEL